MSDSMDRIAAALERIAPAPLETPDFDAADAFVWHVEPDRLQPVPERLQVAALLVARAQRAAAMPLLDAHRDGRQ